MPECCVCGICVFFCKQKTAYEMRISDWSSDVCSSDLAEAGGVQLVLHLFPERGTAQRAFDALVHLFLRDALVEPHAEGDVLVDRHRERRRLLEHHEIGRASCRERVCQYV